VRLPGLIAAAIEVLADIDARNRPAAEALRDWGLSHRFAGSGDRATIGNLVYDALRRHSSLAWRMSGDTPWHLALGVAVFEWGETPASLNAAFAEDRHAPPPIPEGFIAADLASAPEHVRADIPEWLAPELAVALGGDWVAEGVALAGRPPLDMRVNTLKASREKVQQRLSRLGVAPTPHSPVGIRIQPSAGARRHPNVQAEEAFQRGRIEVQDEGSQLCALLVGARSGEQLLDLCAGAGGKTLALAVCMENRGQIHATDSDRSRLAPIYERLKRAGVRNVQVHAPAPGGLAAIEGQMDRVLVDAPCTGTGVWRRRPDAKWRVTPDALSKRIAEQDAVLADAARFVKPGGALVYVTCTLLRSENDERVAVFLAAHPDFRALAMEEVWRSALPDVAPPARALGATSLLLTPLRAETDGFFLAMLARE
jgi:16S rRNA (cytosine967-C5)-methyltransferase